MVEESEFSSGMLSLQAACCGVNEKGPPTGSVWTSGTATVVLFMEGGYGTFRRYIEPRSGKASLGVGLEGLQPCSSSHSHAQLLVCSREVSSHLPSGPLLPRLLDSIWFPVEPQAQINSSFHMLSLVVLFYHSDRKTTHTLHMIQMTAPHQGKCRQG